MAALSAASPTLAGPAYMMQASDALVPSGLGVGDTFHIIFVTHGGTTAASSNIADYDQVAQIQASSLGSVINRPGLNWKGVVSTSSVSAKDHTEVSAAVYLPDGTLVATGFADLWDGSIAHAVNINQLGTEELGFGGAVFTGTESNGSIINPLGGSPAQYGRYFATTGGWLSDGAVGADNSFPIYGISELIQVAAPASVPEPSTLVLAGIGLLAGAWIRRR